MAEAVQRPPPAVSIIESEEILQYINPSLLKLDYNDTYIKQLFIGGGFVFFAAVFFGSIFICNLFPAFRALQLKHKVFMSLAICRGIFGIFAIFLGSYSIFKTTNLDRDVVYGTNATTFATMYITLGFFIFELSAVILSDLAFKTFSKMLILHHGLALVAYTLAITLKANFCFGCKALLLEMSTPFSCLCYVFLKAGMERSSLWWLNQIVLVHTFHLRSVLECHLWYISYNNWEYIISDMPTAIFILLYTNLTLITFIMTPYWGYKKTQQLFNPVDWNFQESRNTDHLTNGEAKTVNGEPKKMI